MIEKLCEVYKTVKIYEKFDLIEKYFFENILIEFWFKEIMFNKRLEEITIEKFKQSFKSYFNLKESKSQIKKPLKNPNIEKLWNQFE